MCAVVFCEKFKQRFPCVNWLWTHEIELTEDEDSEVICVRCSLLIILLEDKEPHECDLGMYLQSVE